MNPLDMLREIRYDTRLTSSEKLVLMLPCF